MSSVISTSSFRPPPPNPSSKTVAGREASTASRLTRPCTEKSTAAVPSFNSRIFRARSTSAKPALRADFGLHGTRSFFERMGRCHTLHATHYPLPTTLFLIRPPQEHAARRVPRPHRHKQHQVPLVQASLRHGVA